MQEQRLTLEWDVLVEENLQNAPIRKEIYCIYKSAFKSNSIVGILQKVNNWKLVPTSTQMNFCNPSLQVNKRKNALKQNSWWCLVKRRNWKVWLYCIFCCNLSNCKKQGEQFYSRNDLLIFWHKTSVNVAWRENRVILDILLQKYNVCGFIHAKHIHNKWSSSHWHFSWWCIHPGLPHGSECRVFLKLNAAHIQSSNDSWWQVLYEEKIWSFWIFCCKNTTYVVLFMHSTYIISEFTNHRLVVAMGRGR